MKLLIFELTSSNLERYGEIFCEGFPMLSLLCKDLSKYFQIYTILDSKLKPYSHKIKAEVLYTKDDFSDLFNETLDRVDASLIIAPEHDGSLQRLVKMAEKKVNYSLNCEVNSVSEVSDKSLLYSKLERKGLKVGKYAKAEELKANSFNLPLVLKPTKGVACHGTKLIQNFKQLEFIKGSYIVQEYIKGYPLSLSLLVKEDGSFLLLSVNKQRIHLGFDSSEYLGGIVPYPLDYKNLKHIIEKALSCFKGLKGYIGIDFVFDGKEIYIMDINPRLTTSYVGLSLSTSNLGEVMYYALIKKRDENLNFHSYCSFKKIREINGLETYLLSPPIKYPVLVAKLFNNLKEAEDF
ncbi:MAG: ATP-grasp domain-containing protein [Nitrososphaerales archaeon]